MIPSTWWQWAILGAFFALAILQECFLLPRAERKARAEPR